MPAASNWTAVSESPFQHERGALDFVRRQFPGHEPYRAWSNFSFLALDGTINEVDLLVFSPNGFFLIEIKGHPGRLTGDAGTWTFEHEGRRTTIDNPVFLADLKAKKLKNLLDRQRAVRGAARIPRIEAAIFCSAEGLQVDLPEQARARLLLRDRPGILNLFTNRAGLEHCGGGIVRTASPDVYISEERLRLAREVLRHIPGDGTATNVEQLVAKVEPVVASNARPEPEHPAIMFFS